MATKRHDLVLLCSSLLLDIYTLFNVWSSANRTPLRTRASCYRTHDRHFLTQERIGRYTSQLLSLVSSSWLPIRTNALICLGNSLFFHEPNRRRVETADGALLDLLG